MAPLHQQAALQAPDWWFESWGLQDWLGTLFDQPVEMHAFVLGLFVGAVLATVLASGRTRTALTATLAVLLFTFGTFETVLCSASFSACHHLQLKPWYFVGGFLGGYGFVLGLHRRTDLTVPGRETERESSALSGILIAVLLGLAAYSALSPTPVHPITGLATVGGFLGSLLGVAGYQWVRTDSGDGPGYLDTLERCLRDETSETVFVASYGTTLGFGYPRMLWELGSLLGRDGFLIGPITWARYGLPSVAMYVGVLFVGSVLWRWIGAWRRGDRVSGQCFGALVVGFGTYAFVLFAATGFALTVWFPLL